MKKLIRKMDIFQKRNFKTINRLTIVVVIIVFIAGLFWYFKLNLFFSDRYDWYMYMSFKYTNLDSEKSMEYANKAIELNPEKPEGYYRKIRIFTALEKYEQVEIWLDDFKKRFPELLPYYYWRMGLIRLNQNTLNASREYFEEGVKSLNNEKDIFLSFYYVGLGIIDLKNRNFEEALGYFNESLLYVEYTDKSLFGIRESYNVEEIVEYNQNLVTGYAHAGMGFAYQELGLNQKAQEEFEIAGEYDRDSFNYIQTLISQPT